MSSQSAPRRPLPIQVYRRRRAAALVVLCLVLLGGFFGVRALLGAGPSAEDQNVAINEEPAPTASAPNVTQTERHAEKTKDRPDAAVPVPPVAAPSSPAPPAAPACTKEQLKIEAISEPAVVTRGGVAQLKMRATNTGSAPCSVDAGAKAVEIQVLAGPERMWSSDDCSDNTSSSMVTVEPGKSLLSKVTWTTTRSAPGCPATTAPLSPGPFSVLARLGDFQSPPTTIELQ